MTLKSMSAGVVLGWALLLPSRSTNAFVAPAAPGRNDHHLAPSFRSLARPATTAATRLGEVAATAPHGAAAATRRCRRRSRIPNPPLMSSSADESGAAAPVDAELAESGGEGGGGAEVGGDGAAVETGDTATRAALKQKLLRKVATLNRGFLAQEADRVDVEEIVEMLEMENPNPNPCAAFESGSSPLAGRWLLLYTTSLDVLSLQINPAVTVGKIFQEIESDGKAIQNIIELQPPFAAVNKVLGSSMATLTVKLETDPVSDSRINLKFVRTEIKADSLFGRKLDLPTLGVDLPSAEKLEGILPKGGGGVGDGGGDLKGKLEDAKSKARALAQKARDKKKDLKSVVERRIKGGSAKSTDGESGGDVDSEEKEGPGGDVVDVEMVAEGTKEEAKEEEGGKDEEADKEKSSSSSDGGDGEAESAASPSSSSTSSSSASLTRKPYFESTYCDEDLRVGRTGNGDMFVSVRA